MWLFFTHLHKNRIINNEQTGRAVQQKMYSVLHYVLNHMTDMQNKLCSKMQLKHVFICFLSFRNFRVYVQSLIELM